MSDWETCVIEMVVVETEKSGWLSYRPGVFRWEARTITPAGEMTLLKSEEWEGGPGYAFHRSSKQVQFEEEIKEAEYQGLIGRLTGAGWELETGQGRIVQLKRPREKPGGGAATEMADLLKQLANLRQAGVLSEEEFEAKRAEILKGF